MIFLTETQQTINAQAGTAANGSALLDLLYTYDEMGNITSIEDWKLGLPQTQAFTYDFLDRLTSASATGGTQGLYSESYAYSATTGNLTTKGGVSLSYGDSEHPHAVTGAGSNTYSYDENGSQTERVVDGNTVTLEYDAANHIIAADGTGIDLNYVYDGDGKMVKKIAPDGVTVYIGNYLEVFVPDSQNPPTATASFQPTKTPVLPTATRTSAPTRTPTQTPTVFTRTPTPTRTATQSAATPTKSKTPTKTITLTKTKTPTKTLTKTRTPSFTVTKTIPTATKTLTPLSATRTPTATRTATKTLSPTPTASPTAAVPGGQVWKYYYYATSIRIALRVKSTSSDQVFYLFGDHLGSTSLVVDPNGNPVNEMRFKAWGEMRYEWGASITDYTYTGQREETDLGLTYYNARWYDPYLNRWNQPDTIVSDQNSILDWDRYSYVRNNPIRYSDPTGHMIDDGCRTEGCEIDSFDEYLSVTQFTIAERFAASHPHHDDFADPIADKIFSTDNPLTRGAYFGWALERSVSGGPNTKQALVDLLGISLSNLSTGLIGLAVGGDVEPSGGVYKITNPNGDVVRVGRTQDLTRREGEYYRDPNYIGSIFEPVYRSDDYAEQRGLEQIIFEEYNQPPMNINRPISVRNSKGPIYIQAALDYLQKIFGSK
jgi:RHS repeat-associated protein